MGTEESPNFACIDNYWDEDAVGKVFELLHEYQELFPTNFSELKGIVDDMGVMKITLKPGAKPMKQRSYRLTPKYKEKVKEEPHKIVAAGTTTKKFIVEGHAYDRPLRFFTNVTYGDGP